MVGDELDAVALLLFVGLILGGALLCIREAPEAVVALGVALSRLPFASASACDSAPRASKCWKKAASCCIILERAGARSEANQWLRRLQSNFE